MRQPASAAGRPGIPAGLWRNTSVPQRDSAIQVLVAAPSRRGARLIAAGLIAAGRAEVPAAFPVAALPAGYERRADRLRSSPADRPHGRACCERLRGNPRRGSRISAGPKRNRANRAFPCRSLLLSVAPDHLTGSPPKAGRGQPVLLEVAESPSNQSLP